MCRIVAGAPVWRFRCDCGELGPEQTGPEAYTEAGMDALVHEQTAGASRADWSIVEGWLRRGS